VVVAATVVAGDPVDAAATDAVPAPVVAPPGFVAGATAGEDPGADADAATVDDDELFDELSCSNTREATAMMATITAAAAAHNAGRFHSGGPPSSSSYSLYSSYPSSHSSNVVLSFQRCWIA
jgi:hypothetical protein